MIFGKLGSPYLWNLSSFAVQGSALLLLQLLVSRYYTPADLGVFNQVFSVFIIVSQLAVGGVHLSAQKHLSEREHSRAAEDEIATSALACTLLMGLAWSLALWVLGPTIGHYLESPGTSQGIFLVVPGLLVFSLNKTLLGSLNGTQRMGPFFWAQGQRGWMMLLVFLGLMGMGRPGSELPLILTLSEVSVFLFLLPWCWRWLRGLPRVTRSWVMKHMDFGTRGLAAGILQEVNTRVDVLILGYFLDDSQVGVYSFAAILAEGMSQLPTALRANTNPKMSRLWAAGQRTELASWISKLRWRVGSSFAALALFSVIAFPWITPLVAPGIDVGSAHLVFGVLALGLALQAGDNPFMQFLLQTGSPGRYSLYVGSVVLINIALNLAFVPWFGMVGAAAATACALLFSVLAFRRTITRELT